MALAGSIQRGATPAEDDALAQELLDDPKNRARTRFRRRRAARAARAADRRARHRRRAGSAAAEQHPALVHAGARDAQAQDRACCRWSRRCIPPRRWAACRRRWRSTTSAAVEPVPRGWYASPVGWIDDNLDGAFAVAIRSAISQKERVWLYAGRGHRRRLRCRRRNGTRRRSSSSRCWMR